MPKKKTKIPDGWMDYRPIREVLYESKLVPFKTPLPATKFEMDHMIPFKWTPFDLMDYLYSKGLRLGLIIDFTNKYPAYYNIDDFTSNGVEYIKIGCVGHDVPDENNFRRFYGVVEDFMFHNSTNNRVIGVHCTHGINRTGYMVCRYLIQRYRFHPSEALHMFAMARGYPVERENYIQALYDLIR